jgi:hypothetical protein
MPKITYPDKVTGDQFYATEATEIKTVVNGLDDNKADKTELTLKLDKTAVKNELGTSTTDLVSQNVISNLANRFKYSILFPNETEVYGDYCNVNETITAIVKSSNVSTVEYRTDGGAWKNIATGGNMPFTRVAGTLTDYRITFLANAARYGSLIIEGKENN